MTKGIALLHTYMFINFSCDKLEIAKNTENDFFYVLMSFIYSMYVLVCIFVYL